MLRRIESQESVIIFDGMFLIGSAVCINDKWLIYSSDGQLMHRVENKESALKYIEEEIIEKKQFHLFV